MTLAEVAAKMRMLANEAHDRGERNRSEEDHGLAHGMHDVLDAFEADFEFTEGPRAIADLKGLRGRIERLATAIEQQWGWMETSLHFEGTRNLLTAIRRPGSEFEAAEIGRLLRRLNLGPFPDVVVLTLCRGECEDFRKGVPNGKADFGPHTPGTVDGGRSEARAWGESLHGPYQIVEVP